MKELIKVNYGASKEEIIKLVNECGAKYIIFDVDHYRGNSKGYYMTTEHFNDYEYEWSNYVDDRGVIGIKLSTEEIFPIYIQEKRSLVNQLYNLEYKKDKIYKDTEPLQKVDGRWSVNNPKYIIANKINDNIINKRNAKIKVVDEEMDVIKKQLSYYQEISSTYWENNN